MSKRRFEHANNPVFTCAEAVLLLPFGRRSFLPAIVDAYGGEAVTLDETTDREVYRLKGVPADITLVYSGMGSPAAANALEMVAAAGARRVVLNDFTVTINAVRSHVGGNLECFPRTAFTLGMRQILGSRRIRLYCRNGCGFDWANTVLRLALFARPGDDYPVTYIRDCDYVITADRETLQCPVNPL